MSLTKLLKFYLRSSMCRSQAHRPRPKSAMPLAGLEGISKARYIPITCIIIHVFYLVKNTHTFFTYSILAYAYPRIVVACLTAVREMLGSNSTVGIITTATVTYCLEHGCTPLLQCLGRVSLPPSMGL